MKFAVQIYWNMLWMVETS